MLDGDDRLVGEDGDQIYLLVGEWLGLFPRHGVADDGFDSPNMRYGEDAPVARSTRGFRQLVLGIRKAIGDVHDGVRQDRPRGHAAPAGGRGNALRSVPAQLAGTSASAARWISLPSNLNTEHSRASQSRIARSAIVLNTGCTSVGELLMTRRISLVAVCCPRASVIERCKSAYDGSGWAPPARRWRGVPHSEQNL